MNLDDGIISSEDALQLWAVLAANGKAPPDVEGAARILPSYSVAIDPWLDRLATSYLRSLSRTAPHFKLVVAPYGGGKTHFLLELATRARRENFAVSYVPCGAGVSLDDSLTLYSELVKQLYLPGETEPGLRRLLDRTVQTKREAIAARGVPDVELALDRWVHSLHRTSYPVNAFGRVMAAALRGARDEADSPAGDAAFRWLQGEPATLGRAEMRELNLARIPARQEKKFGRELLQSLVQFLPESKVYGLVLLIDEVETLFTTKGRALQRVLAAMRILVDLPYGSARKLPLFGVFAAVPDIMEQMEKYPALEQRFKVVGLPFQDGNDFAAQLRLGEIGKQETMLSDIGRKLVEVGRRAKGVSFDEALQTANARTLARVAAERDLDVNARRLYVKTWVSLLEEQTIGGERRLGAEELSRRYQGAFDSLRDADGDEFEP